MIRLACSGTDIFLKNNKLKTKIFLSGALCILTIATISGYANPGNDGPSLNKAILSFIENYIRQITKNSSLYWMIIHNYLRQ